MRLLFVLVFFLSAVFSPATAAEGRAFIHMKTGLKHDDAPICVAYNMIWAALREGLEVDVLVDADAINTFRKGRFSGKDDIEGYNIPQNLREEMARQFSLPVEETPKTYGGFMNLLHEAGAKFHINKAFLVVAGIAENPDEDMGGIADYAKQIFRPVSLSEMINLRRGADVSYTF
ncbi:MAG: hypothetical protein HAW59_00405 [Betaproteobacteria bacterium]|nr:hypothetical protein [Betaproteobacteria bacterium]